MTLTVRVWPIVMSALAAASLGAAASYGKGVTLLEIPLAVAAAAAVLALVHMPTVGVDALAVLIAVFPVARIVIGGAPIYVTDAIVLLLLIGAVRRRERLSGYAWVVVLYLLSWLISWAHQVDALHLFLAPTYGLVRNVIAVSVFFPAYLVARRQGPRLRLVIAVAAGAALTSVLALFQDGAPTAANRFLDTLAPSFTATALKTYPHRAFALFTAPTTLCGFLALAVVLAAGVGTTVRRNRTVLVAASMACVLGALATYSRQWVPAVAAGILALAWLRLGATRKLLMGTLLIAAVTWTAFASGALNSAYLAKRFHSLGHGDANVQTRISRQKEFLELARSGPSTFLIGKGFAGQDLVKRGLVAPDQGGALRAGLNDNVFLLEVFNHGLAAGLLYLGLFVTAVRRVFRAARAGGSEAPMLAGVGAALIAAFVLQLSDNYLSEAVFMKTFLWMLVGTGIGLAERRPTAAFTE